MSTDRASSGADRGLVAGARDYADLRAAAATVLAYFLTVSTIFVFAGPLSVVVGGLAGGYLRDGREHESAWAGAVSAGVGAVVLLALVSGAVVTWVLLPSGGESANPGAPIVFFLLLVALAGVLLGLVALPLAWVAGLLVARS